MINELFPRAKYCFDTSALVDSWRRYYWLTNFPGFWKSIGEMMDAGEIICCEMAWREIQDGNDELTKWIESHPVAKIEMEEEQLSKVQELLGEFPKMADYNRPRVHHADPFVIALASLKGIKVVSMEGGGDQNNPKIPFVCGKKSVPCLSVSGFINEIGWVFDNK